MDDEELYCICRKPYKGNEFMIECDVCKEWYHGKCVKVSEAESNALESYHCPSCAVDHGPSVLRMKKFQSRTAKDSNTSASNSDVSQRTLALISRLKRRAYAGDSDSPLLKLNASELTLDYFAKKGFTHPILIARKDGLNLQVPSISVRIDEIEQLLPSDLMLDVIDVLEQDSVSMSVSDFIRYWNSPRKEKVYNVISLEVTGTQLGELVEAPRIVRELSWVDQFWPDDGGHQACAYSPVKSNIFGITKRDESAQSKPKPKPKGSGNESSSSDAEESHHRSLTLDDRNPDENEEDEPVRLSIDDQKPKVTPTVGASDEKAPASKPMKPRVAKFCLISSKGSFTNFHIDFGGTSAWYHVARGEKVFYLIPPSEQSLRLYENWMWMSKQAHRDVFLCDQVRECHRVVVKQGQTLLLPAGWIHAVYTPVDALVFGGNFLHSFNAGLQVRIYELEKRLRTPSKFMFPFFQTVYWYAARALRDAIVNHASRDYTLEAARAVSDALKNWTATKENYKLNRLYIPDSIDHQDIMTELDRLVSQAKRSVIAAPQAAKATKSRSKLATASVSGSDSDSDRDTKHFKQRAPKLKVKMGKFFNRRDSEVKKTTTSPAPVGHGDAESAMAAERWKQPLKIRMKPRNRLTEQTPLPVVQLPELVVFDDGPDDEAGLDSSRANASSSLVEELPPPSETASAHVDVDVGAASVSLPSVERTIVVANSDAAPVAAMPITKLKIRLSTAVTDPPEDFRESQVARRPLPPIGERANSNAHAEKTTPTSKSHRETHKAELKMRIPKPVQLRLSDSSAPSESSDSDDQVERWTSKLKQEREKNCSKTKKRRPQVKASRKTDRKRAKERHLRVTASLRDEAAAASTSQVEASLGRRQRKVNVRDDFVSGSEFESDGESDFGSVDASPGNPDADWKGKDGDKSDEVGKSSSSESDELPLDNEPGSSDFEVSDDEEDEDDRSSRRKPKRPSDAVRPAKAGAGLAATKRQRQLGAYEDEESKRRKLNEAILNDHGFMARAPKPTVAENEQRIQDIKQAAKVAQRRKPVTAKQRIGKILGLST